MAQLLAAAADKSIGQRIQQKRKEFGYSAEKLSELINLSQQQLSRYERGVSKINVNHLIDIAILFNTPISWFFQDCMPDTLMKKELKEMEINQKWENLSSEQKRAFVAFLDTLK
ncbi:helix-turn-helix domain-containing protein [Rodentibacter trehalosifermentans]|uniref:Transcriptional regulator n=1 Tax=Rodentibacter trehalosifermentans TaxID=1908263 RepID=A0A1V3J243_9PAST|nr:helix-turn-helix transcriptional regulator [Rodentibacter trehalosifermentans]OOF48876.1 transcriptional regulator [Rodentibacter trehalosifermentans]OOF52249.1 transcriptional regulator [Rodentibacter trehalosifermentans]